MRWLLPTLVLAIIGLAYALFDWNLFKGYAERRMSAATGREFHIDGNLDVRLSMQPLVTMDGLRMGNVNRATPSMMASAQRLQFRVELWPLLSGQTILPEVHLTKPSVLLERYRDGSDNWTFPSSGSNPVIRQFTVDHGELHYLEDATHTDFVIDIDSDKPAPSRLAPLNFQGKGTFRNNSFSLAGHADSPLDLANTQTPYRIDIGAIAGATRAHASGALRHPLQLTGFSLDFTLAGPDLAELYQLLGIAMPETPPYHLHGTLGHIGHVWTFDRFTGMVGKSDLAGDVRIDNTGQRKLLTTKLASRNLDVHDLAGFVGAPAHVDPRKALTPQQVAEAVQAESTDRLLPQKPYDLEHLRGMDSDVELRARRVVGTPVPLDDLLVRMTIDQGVVHLHPFDFGAAGGKVNSAIVLDASKPVIATSAKIKARGVDFAQLVPNVPAIQRSAGRIGINLDLHGTGNSIAKMFATSNGRATAVMGGGKVSDLLMAYAALNIARILKLKIVGDHD
ncbi:MAG TPA: AsmA family protein, partial [Xanthomonadaceae bacterium]|nr:AsmA family protein [Xanthomonadaceae bacterium]